MFAIKTAYLSEKGGRVRNEDACGYWVSGHLGCWVVSDGAGGHGSGDVASRIVVSTILQTFSQNAFVAAEYAAQLLHTANNAVINAKRSGITRDNMHATATLLVIDAEAARAIWCHAGDTRLYLIRDGRIVHRSRDHSLVQNLIDAGYGGEEIIRGHPQRSLLTSAVGSDDPIELAVGGENLSLLAGDVFLICTDGWWEYVDEPLMLELLARSGSPEDWLARMSAALNGTVNGENDNYTAMCIYVEAVESPTTVIRPAEAETAAGVLSLGDPA
ncbi:PP2C family serine/threonine-protein phosphatase [Niveibacterium sp. SC-1]|uniref:PP2C family protein-serine/threonine phosphatase n=1 Tax=Niveibacterium sp. SC-1 TaxID=3135646 RepID=UPI00311FF039